MGKQRLTAKAAVPVAIVHAVMNEVLGGVCVPNNWDVLARHEGRSVHTSVNDVRVTAVFEGVTGDNFRINGLMVICQFNSRKAQPDGFPLLPRYVEATVDASGIFIKILAVKKTPR